MITVRISNILFGGYVIIRRAEIPEELLGKLTTHIYTRGGVELQEEKNHFRVPAPMLSYIVKELEEMLHIKFVEEKGWRVD